MNARSLTTLLLLAALGLSACREHSDADYRNLAAHLLRSETELERAKEELARARQELKVFRETADGLFYAAEEAHRRYQSSGGEADLREAVAQCERYLRDFPAGPQRPAAEGLLAAAREELGALERAEAEKRVEEEQDQTYPFDADELCRWFAEKPVQVRQIFLGQRVEMAGAVHSVGPDGKLLVRLGWKSGRCGVVPCEDAGEPHTAARRREPGRKVLAVCRVTQTPAGVFALEQCQVKR